MRSGVLFSAVCHVGLVSLVMLSAPRQFVATERSVEAELVREDEVPQAKEQPKPEPPKPEAPKPEKPNVWDFPPDKPLIELPQFSPQARPNASEPAPSQAKSAPPPPQQAPAPSAPSNSQQAALSPNPLPQSSIAREAPSAQPKAAPSVFDPANIPMLMDLPNQQGGAVDKGFDFEATVTANISGEDRAAFKAHLRKCWKLPDGLSPGQNTRVVLRVYLKRDGALASEPVLIEASASRDGPAVLQAAKSALTACQPYALPAEKYREWRILDLTFTPKDMAGG
jgi:outer membrane biosynthesis protein TonB